MKPAIHLMLDPDVGPLGYGRDRPVSEYPRRYVTVDAPLSWPHRAAITLPARLSEREWEVFMDYLAVAREALVGETP